jgi:hypothetical protein
MQIFFRENDQDPDGLAGQLETACEGLVLISETDGPVTPFLGGPATEVTAQTILQQTGRSLSEPVEERDFDAFFERLTTIRDWYGETEKERAKKFLELYKLLKENLRDRKVFRIGRIRVDIYAVGLYKDGQLTGVSTYAVET